MADTIADPHAEPPDVSLFERKVVSGIRKMARSWPSLERRAFEMHFFEGMSSDGLAATFECDRAKIEQILGLVRARLRTRFPVATSPSAFRTSSR